MFECEEMVGMNVVKADYTSVDEWDINWNSGSRVRLILSLRYLEVSLDVGGEALVPMNSSSPRNRRSCVCTAITTELCQQGTRSWWSTGRSGGNIFGTVRIVVWSCSADWSTIDYSDPLEYNGTTSWSQWKRLFRINNDPAGNSNDDCLYHSKSIALNHWSDRQILE